MKYSDRELEKADEWLGMSPEEQMYTSGKQQVHEPKEQDVCPECLNVGEVPYMFGDGNVSCPTCKGECTGKALVDKIREAFEHMCSDFCLRYDFSVIGVDQYKDANTHQAFCIFAGQQAEIERLRAENEDLKCCGNCEWHNNCFGEKETWQKCDNWQPKENN